jgi:RHS repeat-associated protein
MTKLAVSRGHCDYPSLRGAPGRTPWNPRPVLEGTLSGDTFTTVNKYVWEGNTHSTSSGQAYYSSLVYSMLGGTWRYHMYDGLGSTRQLMLHVSPYTVTDTYQYEAFGNLMSSTGTAPNPYKYVGSLGYYQTGSSLMHLGARYYMPALGGFLTPDPFQQMQKDHQYCGGAPTDRVDPSGLAFGLTPAKCNARYWQYRNGIEQIVNDCKCWLKAGAQGAANWFNNKCDSACDAIFTDPRLLHDCHRVCHSGGDLIEGAGIFSTRICDVPDIILTIGNDLLLKVCEGLARL